MKHIIVLSLTILLLPQLATADVGDLLITEVSVTPTVGEFIEIYNNGATEVILTNVYITDATFTPNSVFYYQVVIAAGGGGAFADFHARFPAGASIAAGEYQTIALNGSTDFINTYGQNPTYELYEDGGAPDATPDMLEAVAGSINGQGGLSGGEFLALYSWDGINDLVQDLDYVVWGDRFEAVDKSGIAIDSLTDGDNTTSTYLNDTATAAQAGISATPHAGGNSWQRGDLNEGVETQTGGNGFNGSDETSEDFNNTFFEGVPTPNAVGTPPPPTAPNIVINEVDAVGTAEFIEIFDGGLGATSLADVTVIFYEGTNNTIYHIIDLTGNNTDANGYFVIGDASLTPDLLLTQSLNDDASAVAVYFSNASNFALGQGISNAEIIDALVYDSGQVDDTELLTLLNVGEAQINEDANGAAVTESNARCPNGTGGALNTSTYNQVTPTAGTINNLCPVGDYYASVDTTDATTLRTTVHNIIKNAITYNYSGGGTDTWELLSFADEDPSTDADPNVVENVWMLYRNISYPFLGGGMQAYNREHTWPQSRGFSSGSQGTNNFARTDAHHLMMSDVGYNSDRGNKFYDNCNAACTERTSDVHNGQGGGSGTYPGNSNWFDGDSFEVWAFRKGDVARAMFYMDVRYEGDQIDTASNPPGLLEPDLQLTDSVSQLNAGGPFMGLLSVLLQWHLDDPVDAIELGRNEEVFAFQSNRNPFVDHPEWVACIFQDICPDNSDIIFTNGFDTP
jgi:endonuclease I